MADVNDTDSTAVNESAEPAVNLVDNFGNLSSVPQSQASAYVNNPFGGYQIAPDELVNQYFTNQKYNSLPQRAIAGAEEAAKSATFGLSTGFETAAGVNPEDIAQREQHNPWYLKLPESVAGLVGSSFIPGVGEANILHEAGTGAAELLPRVAEANAAGTFSSLPLATKLGSYAARGAVEGGLIGAGDEVSKMFSNQSDPNTPVQTALINIGLTGLGGGALGLGAGGVGELWNATVGPKVAGFLNGTAAKLGGIDGVTDPALKDAIAASGVENIPPVARAAISDDPMSREFYKDIRQSPTPAGLQAEEQMQSYRDSLATKAIEAAGSSKDAVEHLDTLSPRENGQMVANTLKSELETAVKPLSDGFEDLKASKADIPLSEDKQIITPGATEYDPPNVQTQKGIKTELSERLGALAVGDHWAEDTPSFKALNNIQSGLQNLETVGDLTNFISRKGSEFYDPMNPQLNRDVQSMLSILRDGESQAVLDAFPEAGPDMVAKHQLLKSEWQRAAEIAQILDSRLHLRGGSSVGSFIEALSDAADDKPEQLISRLSNKKDSTLAKLLAEKFPQTSAAIRKYQLDTILKNSLAGATEEGGINLTRFFKQIDDLSPEARNSLFSKEQLEQLEGIRTQHEALQNLEKDKNFSNTAPTFFRLLKNIGGSVVGMISAITGHSAATTLLLSALADNLGKSFDAVKLGYLKFLGTAAPVDAPAFKKFVDYIAHVQSGESALNKTLKNVFQSTQNVIPSQLIPTPKNRQKLSKQVDQIQVNPTTFASAAQGLNHYAPDHAGAMTLTQTNALNTLASLKPNTSKTGLLDKAQVPSEIAKAKYDRALDLAEQPLMLLQHMKDGTLNSGDIKLVDQMYPQLRSRMNYKLMEEISNQTEKGQEIPYSLRPGLSLMLGQPVDSSFSPQSILSSQNVFANPISTSTSPEGNKSQHKPALNSFKKLSAMEETPLQARMGSKE